MQTNNNNVNQLVTAGLVVGGLIAGVKVMQAFGLIDSEAEKAKQQEIDTVVKNEANTSAQQVAGTLSNAQLALIADTIYEDLRYSSIADEKDAAVNEVLKCRNNTDWLNLIVAFGTRQNYFLGWPWGNKQNLVEFLQSNLYDWNTGYSRFKALNSEFSKRGIKQQFTY